MIAVLWMVVTPVSPVGKAIAALLGAVAVGAGLYFLRADRAASVDAAPQSEDEEDAPACPPVNAPSLTERAFWRRPNAFAMIITGLLVAGAAWIDPNAFPRLFVLTWMLVLIFVFILMTMGGLDLFMLRRAALQERQRLARENREQLTAGLPARRRLRMDPNASAPTNGAVPHD